jgi:hypothetical protein
MKNKYIISLVFISTLFFSCKKDTCVEKPKDDCMCYEIYAPVCGCNNVTYSNDCHAECAGITDYTQGECGSSNGSNN